MLMLLPDLHVTGSCPDWEQVAPEEWNHYQRRAAETGGWDTPANRETLRGAVVSSIGLALLKHDTGWSSLVGTGLLAFGRSRDLRDGAIAEATGTKSQLGEKLDSGTDTVLLGTLDKILTDQGTLSRAEAGLMLGCAGVKVAAVGIAESGSKELHPNRMGKYSMFAQWSALHLYTASRAAHNLGAKKTGKNLSSLARGLNYAGIGVGIVATGRYLVQSIRSNPGEESIRDAGSATS